MLYTVRKLDRRFKLHRAGFEVLLVWPECRLSINSPGAFQEFYTLRKRLEEHCGTPYYEYAYPQGRWHSEYRYVDDTYVVPKIFLKNLKQLTLVQLL
jgi:hypothetical protein